MQIPVKEVPAATGHAVKVVSRVTVGDAELIVWHHTAIDWPLNVSAGFEAGHGSLVEAGGIYRIAQALVLTVASAA